MMVGVEGEIKPHTPWPVSISMYKCWLQVNCFLLEIRFIGLTLTLVSLFFFLSIYQVSHQC